RPARGRERRGSGALPEIGVVEITEIDIDGEMHGRPLAGRPRDILVSAERGAPALGIGERAVVRFVPGAGGGWEARIIRALGGAPDRVLGIYRRRGDGGVIEPTDRKLRSEFRVSPRDAGEAQDGEIVLAEVQAQAAMGLPAARILERLGDSREPRAFSLIAIHSHGIPTAFSAEALALAERATPVTLGERADLRAIPLVTIDGADARDFDDAVWAEPDPEQDGAWHAIVAIADVAWYVRPEDALDRAAEERGNSVYFPDRVVPMLPEALSNELCSLKPGVDRACLAVDLWIDGEGRLRRHRFRRGLMRSAERFTYEEVQDAIEGRPNPTTTLLIASVLRPLYGVFAALERGEDAVERTQHACDEKRGGRVGPAFDRVLHLFIGEPLGRAHQPAPEAMAAQPALAIDPQIDREAGAIDAGLQGAELVRERLREHRHDAVGEIDRVAALFGSAVERILGPDIPGDIGDGDDRMPGAVLLGIGLGPNRIVEIARIGAVDRHQWDRAQIGALAKRHRRCALGECQRFRRECRRDAVAVDGDEAEGTRFAAIAETLENARGGKAHGGLRLHL